MVIHTRTELQAQQILLEGSLSDVSEVVLCEVKLEDNDKLLIGSIYRTPNSTAENNAALNHSK